MTVREYNELTKYLQQALHYPCWIASLTLIHSQNQFKGLPTEVMGCFMAHTLQALIYVEGTGSELTLHRMGVYQR